jgi:hypothetical protein
MLAYDIYFEMSSIAQVKNLCCIFCAEWLFFGA